MHSCDIYENNSDDIEKDHTFFINIKHTQKPVYKKYIHLNC